MQDKFFLFAVFVSGDFLFAQDVNLSQYNSFPLHIDKAMVGSKGCSRIVTGIRLQWLDLDGGYKTYYFSYDQYSRHLRSGFGIEYYKNDESNGMITNDFIAFSFSPSISIGKYVDSLRQFVIKPAINFGYFRYNIDYSKFTFGNSIDPLHGFIYTTTEEENRGEVSAPDFGTGILAYGKNFFAGFYYHHLTEPDIAFLYSGDPLPSRIVLHGGYLLKGYKWLGDFVMVPSFIYEKQGEMRRTDITFAAKYRKFALGFSGRFRSSIVFMAGFEHKIIKIGYAYDMNTTAARRAVGSTHEIILGFNFACRKNLKKIRTLDFPAL